MHASLNIKGPGFNKSKDHEAGVKVDLPKVNFEAEAPRAQVEASGPRADLSLNAPRVEIGAAAPKVEVAAAAPRIDLDAGAKAGGHGKMDVDIGLKKPQVGLELDGGLRDPVGEEFNSQCIDGHNRVREAHGVPPLRHSAELTASAQRWADELARDDKFEHSSNRPDDVGENIGMKWESTGTIFTGYQATQQWYDEIDQYTFQGEENLACGHFSQVVWKGTQECGFAKAMTKDGKLIVVGHYAPAGNYVGEWAENVLPPKSGTKVQLPDWPADHPAHEVSLQLKAGEYQTLDHEFSEQVLHTHNEHRARHKAEALSLDQDLSVIAQKHADFLAENHRFEHSRNRYKGGIIGENIACKVISLEPDANDYSAKELIDVWYSEESQYEYDGQSPKLSAGHFTQIVWKGTKVIGVGKAIDKKDNKVIVVVNYYPAGNILKRFRENVNEPAHN